MLGKIEGKRRREQERMIWFDRITNSTDMNLSKRQEIVVTTPRIWDQVWDRPF